MPLVGEFHGTSGPVRTSFNDTIMPVENDVIKACDEVTNILKKPLDPLKRRPYWFLPHAGLDHLHRAKQG